MSSVTTSTSTTAQPIASLTAANGMSQPKAGPAVRALAIGEYKAAALALAEAFFEDNVGRYFLDTPTRDHWTEKQKWDLHLSIYEYVTYAHIMCGLATTAGDDYACVALWMPPGKNTDGLYTLLRSGLWRLKYKLCAEGRRRLFDEFFPMLHDTKAAVLREHDLDSWYLVYLGTKASARGQGLARAVMNATLRQVDVEGKCAYLESSNPVNLPFYRRLGFEISKTIHMKNGTSTGITLDCMRREPQNPQSREKGKVEVQGCRLVPVELEKQSTVEIEVKLSQSGLPS